MAASWRRRELFPFYRRKARMDWFLGVQLSLGYLQRWELITLDLFLRKRFCPENVVQIGTPCLEVGRGGVSVPPQPSFLPKEDADSGERAEAWREVASAGGQPDPDRKGPRGRRSWDILSGGGLWPGVGQRVEREASTHWIACPSQGVHRTLHRSGSHHNHGCSPTLLRPRPSPLPPG